LLLSSKGSIFGLIQRKPSLVNHERGKMLPTQKPNFNPVSMRLAGKAAVALPKNGEV
jgi:hypothetical protein